MPKGNLGPGGRVADLLRAHTGAVDLNAVETRGHAGLRGRQGGRRAGAARPGRAGRGPAGAALRRGPQGRRAQRAARAAGHGHLGQGRHRQARRRPPRPSGIHVASFGKPTKEELAHDFLWRIRAQLPRAGKIGVFDRSHYEDAVTVRVHGTIGDADGTRRSPRSTRSRRSSSRAARCILKCFLDISRDEQRERLLARLDDPTKHWKYNPADLDSRARWDDYMAAYAYAIERSSTEIAPWHLVPADRKWYRNWAVTTLLLEQLDALGAALAGGRLRRRGRARAAASDAVERSADRAQVPQPACRAARGRRPRARPRRLARGRRSPRRRRGACARSARASSRRSSSRRAGTRR